MKKPGIALSIFLSFSAFAEQSANMDEQHMQLMSQKMQDMQKCLQSINKDDLAIIEKRSIEFENVIRALCASGKREQAQKKALSFEKDMSKLPAMQAMKKCTDGLQGAIPDAPTPGQDVDFSAHHACDELGGRD